MLLFKELKKLYCIFTSILRKIFSWSISDSWLDRNIILFFSPPLSLNGWSFSLGVSQNQINFILIICYFLRSCLPWRTLFCNYSRRHCMSPYRSNISPACSPAWHRRNNRRLRKEDAVTSRNILSPPLERGKQLQWKTAVKQPKVCSIRISSL